MPNSKNMPGLYTTVGVGGVADAPGMQRDLKKIMDIVKSLFLLRNFITRLKSGLTFSDRGRGRRGYIPPASNMALSGLF